METEFSPNPVNPANPVNPVRFPHPANPVRFWTALLPALLLVLLLGGCFGGSEEQAPVDEVVRTPRPTFTPTPAQPTPTPPPPTQPPAASGAGGAPGEPLTVPADAPTGVVNSDQVNARKAPSITSDNIIREVDRGDSFSILGKSADDEWWYVCCVDGATAWIYWSYLDITGSTDNVPVSDAIGGLAATQASIPAAPAPTQPPAPTDTPTSPPPAAQPVAPPVVEQPPVEQPVEQPTVEEPAAPTDTPAPAFPFALVAQEQFIESNNLVRVFAYVYQGSTALPGYTLRVTKDGADMPVSGATSDAAGFTWPVANPRQRFQNYKVEFPNVQAGGTWEIQLIDGSGAPAGPPAVFTLSANDESRELYVRYEKP